MMSKPDSRKTPKLTTKGKATRLRILRHAADLIYAHGVQATSNEAIRSAAGVSGSQLAHYFPTKEEVVLGVVDWQADDVLAFHRSEQFGGFDTIQAFQDWADFYVLTGRPFQNGCSLGSLAGELVKGDLEVHDALADAFAQWRSIFTEGIERMRELGRINSSADPVRLANTFLAAYQGGILLAQIAQDIAPLRDALYSAVDQLRTYQVEPDTLVTSPVTPN
ncbi:TetR/AcrR family transcriptional regulator [Leifsonia soli]|uniref:AcrR family transcriptional regulator n=1 Tax=Leifsonia soli TaxID=582665 RepID=A0A852T328_9MICO|nr:TetR/AcrR family transcriptional regulator [Leifsonia soli]NYD76028.1 AcrR family transcriptional regulator [Leifsonia soli]